MHYEIPITSGDPLKLELGPGQTLYILGTNGAGKSSLILELLSQSTSSATRWMSARRQVHLSEVSGTRGFMNFVSSDYRQDTEERQNIFENQLSGDFLIGGRWQELEPEDRLTKPLFELVTRENQRARDIARSVDRGECESLKKQVSNVQSPLHLVNDVLRQSGFKISLSVGPDGKLSAASEQGASYDIAQASDGERNAVIAAATVMTAPEGAVILVDEPDRHLHRSMIVPFMSALADLRGDCSFIVSTYETALPDSQRNARVLVVKSCAWTDGKPTTWELDEIESGKPLPEEVRAMILGARTRTILVEGTHDSLDSRLYSILFSNAAIKGVGGYGEVESAVNALRGNSEYTHIEAFGIVDGDGRSENSAITIGQAGVYLLEAYCVECLYYCEEALTAVATHQAPIVSGDADDLTDRLKVEILDRLDSEDITRQMSARRSWRQVRANITKQMPSWRQIAETNEQSFTIQVESTYQSELEHYRQLLDNQDFNSLATRYPIYKTSALDPIHRVLRLADREAYIDTLLYLVRSDVTLARQLRSRMGAWAETLATGTSHLP